MLTIILRRGGAWRFAAFAVLAASIFSFGFPGPNGIDRAAAHQGEVGSVCGTANIPPFMQYAGQYDSGGIHYHVWSVPYSPYIFLAECGSTGV